MSFSSAETVICLKLQCAALVAAWADHSEQAVHGHIVPPETDMALSIVGVTLLGGGLRGKLSPALSRAIA